jgi:hypothetical protein
VTGPEHYAESERLILETKRLVTADTRTATLIAMAALAQVHADLAQTAAIIDAAGHTSTDLRRENAWEAVLGRKATKA